MTEQFSEYSGFLSEESSDLLERSLTDPQMQRVLDKARACNDYMSVVPVAEEERAKIIRDLDAEWAPWRQQTLIASGSLLIKNNDEVSVRIPLVGVEVISDGFNIRSTPVEESRPQRSRVTHQFYIARSAIEGGDDDTPVAVNADLDEVVLQTDTASPERAIAWLSFSSPEFIKEIDRRILSSRTHEEAIMSLRWMDIDKLVDLEDGLTRNSVETYFSSLLTVDQGVPYGVEVSGRVGEYDNDGELAARSKNIRTMAYVSQLCLGKFSDGGDWRIMMPMSTVPADSNEESDYFIASLDSIQQLISLRRKYYEAQD